MPRAVAVRRMDEQLCAAEPAVALRVPDQGVAVAPQVVQADNVRAALRLVARGEAGLGIVYASDAVAEPGVRVVATFPDSSHQPITYPAALIAPATPESQALLDYLSSPAAAKVFESQGFEVLR